MFTGYNDNTTLLCTEEKTMCDEVVEKYSNNTPYAEYNAEGEIVGYYWYYGDTVDIQFDITGELTVEQDAIVYTCLGEKPTEKTAGKINQKAYNVVDCLSWTCVAIENDRYLWQEDIDYTEEIENGRLLYITAREYLKDKQYNICIKNQQSGLLYSFCDKASSLITLHIDKELSEKLIRGIYYITLTISDDNNRVFIPLVEDKDCTIIVK